MYSDITGIILSGGKSSRMGENKSFLKIQNETIIERIVKLMKSIFDEVMIVTNSPDEYKFLGLPLYKDIYKNKGPLGGIHSGLTHSKSEKNFVISCDVPLMTEEMIEYIVEYKSDKTIKFCNAAGYHQPLAGVYSKSLIVEIEKLISGGDVPDKSFHHFLKMVEAETICPESLPFYKHEIFFNVNNPKDYEEIVKIFLER